ncbi:MAG: hypothetical protein ACUVXF_08140 [Desulfobaccales bacterium]
MKSIRIIILGAIIFIWGSLSLWSQFDMRRPGNPYAGMGRTGFALEERDKKLQQEKEIRKSQEQAAKEKSQNTKITVTPSNQKKK